MNEVKNKENKHKKLSLRIKNQKQKDIVCLLVLITFLFSGCFIVYHWWIDELKFYGKETVFIKAEVKSEHSYHFGEGLYGQRGVAEYSFDDKVYSSEFNNKKFRKIIHEKFIKVGDSLVFKIVKKNPVISKFMGLSFKD